MNPSEVVADKFYWQQYGILKFYLHHVLSWQLTLVVQISIERLYFTNK
jgi:hypothetical protein